MKSVNKIDTALTPDGCEMQLFKHDCDYIIKVEGEDLMSSRQHESELELARLGCAHLQNINKSAVLVGGLGLGYTLRQALDMVTQDSEVVVSELLEPVVKWNLAYLGELNDNPLEDKRVKLEVGDAVSHIENSKERYDSMLLDIDNGPGAFTDAGNQRLYDRDGIKSCMRSLRGKGMLAVWSSVQSKSFERLMLKCGLNFRRYHAAAYKGSRQKSKVIWLASEDKRIFPDGAVESRNVGH